MTVNFELPQAQEVGYFHHKQKVHKNSSRFMKSPLKNSFKDLNMRKNEALFTQRFGNSHINKFNSGIKPPQLDFGMINREREMLNTTRNPFNSLRKSQYFDERSSQINQEGMNEDEPQPHSYQDILSARENQMRLSWPREIKPDPEDIDTSFLFQRKLKKKPKKWKKRKIRIK